MLKHMLTQTGSHPRVVGRGEQTTRTPTEAKIMGIPILDEMDDSPIKKTVETANTGTTTTSTPKRPVSTSFRLAPDISGSRPVSVHGNLTQNQSIYANTVSVPKVMNGTVTTGRGVNANTNITSNNLNTSRLSSSNSPATTNQTKTTNMDSSRDQSHNQEDFDSLTRVSPMIINTSGLNRSASRRSGHRDYVDSTTIIPNSLYATPAPKNTRLLLNSSGMSQGEGHRHNSTAMVSRSNHNSFFGNSFMDNSYKINNTLNNTENKSKIMNSSLIPANVSKLLQMSKDIGVRGAITSLGLLCLVSLLFALLSLVFLLKLSPVTEERRQKLYKYDFLSPSQYVAIYEVTLGMCALSLSLNLCCLLVCTIQFLFAIKLVKSSVAHGRSRTTKYLHEAAVTRLCAIGGFFVSIPLFLTGIILYTFLHFDSTPAIITSVVIGLAIVFCAGAVIHNVFLWKKESRANRTNVGASGGGCNSDCERNYPMSPILKRVIDANHQHHRSCRTKGGLPSNLNLQQKSFVELPQATLDLSGGTGMCNGKLSSTHNSTAAKSALELSTLV